MLWEVHIPIGKPLQRGIYVKWWSRVKPVGYQRTGSFWYYPWTQLTEKRCEEGEMGGEPRRHVGRIRRNAVIRHAWAAGGAWRITLR